MRPFIRVDKLHPDGSPRASWQAYRIDDADGALRLWTPPRTPRIHVNGQWTPESGFVTAWRPGERFVVACHSEPRDFALYIDIVRAVNVSPTRFAYVDLYVDVMLERGRASSKDEDRVAALDPDEAKAVIAIRDALLYAVRVGDPPFRRDDARWVVPEDVRALPAGGLLALS